MESAIIWTVLLVSLVFILQRLSKIGRRPSDYPPGPPTLPLIGNLHLLRQEKVYLQFQEWAKEYGPIYSLILGSRIVIVLNSDQAIKDLLDKRSNIYSSRPELYLGQIVSGGFRMLLMVSTAPIAGKRGGKREYVSNSEEGIRRDVADDSQNRTQQPEH